MYSVVVDRLRPHLLSFEGYPIGLRVEEHSDVKIGVAEPLHCLINVGHRT